MEIYFDYILICILTYVFAGVFASCQDTVTKDVGKGADPSMTSTDVGLHTKQADIFVDSVHVLTHLKTPDFPVRGQFFTALSWTDRLGQNLLILAEEGEYEEGNGQKDLFADHYIRRDSIYDVLWQMHDSVVGLGCDLNIQLINFFPFISDIDSNGVAETAVFYSLDNRCDAVTFPARLVVHEGQSEIVISGMRNQFLGPPENILNEYRAKDGQPPLKYKNLETGTESLDSSIINFYSQQWDEFILLENTLNGSFPDSLIRVIH